MGEELSEQLDQSVRCVEGGREDTEDINVLKNLVAEAELSLKEAENDVVAKKDKLKKLQSMLEDELIKTVSNMKLPGENSSAAKVDMAKKWRMAGMKVRLGVGGMGITKRRDVGNAETFIVKESEVTFHFHYQSITFFSRKPAKKIN